MMENQVQPRQRDEATQKKQEARLRARMETVRRKLLVLSGKGGVGKSTVAANLAVALSQTGSNVGLLDVDIHGPSIPTLMGLKEGSVTALEDALVPAQFSDSLKVLSIGLLLQRSTDAVIWRGPLKFQAIRQLLADVHWGNLDYLVIDCPPGTGDEPLAVAQLVGPPAEAVIVTTPQQLAVSDVRRCIGFCRTVSLEVAGLIENMSGFVCPHCGKRTDLFRSGGGQLLAAEMGVSFLGSIPLDPAIVSSGDRGTPFMAADRVGEAARAFRWVVQKIVRHAQKGQDDRSRVPTDMTAA